MAKEQGSLYDKAIEVGKKGGIVAAVVGGALLLVSSSGWGLLLGGGGAYAGAKYLEGRKNKK